LAKVQLIVHGGVEVEGGKAFEFDLEEKTTLRDLIHVFSSQVWEGFVDTICVHELDRVHESVLLFLNDKNLNNASALDTQLEDGDKVSIFYALEGG